MQNNTTCHWNQLVIFFAAKDGEALYSKQKQDWELTVAQIMNSLLPNSNLKKVGKTTRPSRYDLNQIPYDYTVEVRNRFKGLDLIDRVPEELWTEVRDMVQKRSLSTWLLDFVIQAFQLQHHFVYANVWAVLNILRTDSTSSLYILSENKGRGNTFQLILFCQHYSSTKTR